MTDLANTGSASPRRDVRLKRASAGLLLVLAGCVAALAAMELVVRFGLGVQQGSVESQFWQYDPLLGWSKTPGATGTYRSRWGEFAADVRINNHGLRGPEITSSKPDGVCRVLLLGDSFVVGLEVPEADVLSTQLQADLEAINPGRKFQVVNGATRGYGTDQELLYLKEMGVRLDPDIVLVGVCLANDASNNLATGRSGGEYGKPYFRAAEGRLVLHNSPVPPPARDARPDGAHRSVAGIKRLLGHSSLYQYSAALIVRGFPSITRSLMSMGLIGGTRYRTMDPFLAAYLKSPPASWADGWRLTVGLLEEMAKVCRQENVAFGVFVAPTAAEVYPHDWEATLKLYDLDAALFDVRAPARRLARACEVAAIPFLDLGHAFRQEGARSRLHFRLDGHWNSNGHRLASAQIARFIEEAALVCAPAAEEVPDA